MRTNFSIDFVIFENFFQKKIATECANFCIKCLHFRLKMEDLNQHILKRVFFENFFLKNDKINRKSFSNKFYSRNILNVFRSANKRSQTSSLDSENSKGEPQKRHFCRLSES